MRINVYSEEISDDIEIIEKEVDGQLYTGLRMFMYLPVTIPVKDKGNSDEILGYTTHRGKFMHRPGDDDSSAVTFWAKKESAQTELGELLKKALKSLDEYYDK